MADEDKGLEIHVQISVDAFGRLTVRVGDLVAGVMHSQTIPVTRDPKPVVTTVVPTQAATYTVGIPRHHAVCGNCDGKGHMPLITSWDCTACGKTIVPGQGGTWIREGDHGVRHAKGSSSCTIRPRTKL